MKTLILLALSLLTYSVNACECRVNYSMAENFRDVPIVAEVEVVSINDTSQTVSNDTKTDLIIAHPPFKSGYSVTVKVLEVYKGKPRETLIKLSGNEYCGNRYDLGQKYVLFIYTWEKSYATRICESNFVATDQVARNKLNAILSSN